MKKYLFQIILLLFGLPSSLLAQPIIDLETFATGFNRPVDIQSPGGNDTRLFIVEQDGRIWILDSMGNRNSFPFLDISSQVNSNGNEQGLLGLAFHPDFENNPYIYVHYTALNGNTQVSLFAVSNNPDSVDQSTEFSILNESQPFTNHNGGSIAFGPDSYLYIALGDGGSANDPGDRAQDLTTVLGKILRININTAQPYLVPNDNPFFGAGGNIREEIWAYGLRNPWKMSFDRLTGDLWIGDVGQNALEEIDFQTATSAGGENYGWRCYEGTSQFNTANCPPDSTFTDPVYEYSHSSGGCSVTGGVVYRGNKQPGLNGYYFFSDICTGWISTLDSNYNVINHGTFSSSDFFVAFGENNEGEVFVAGLNDGKISRIVEISTSLKEDISKPFKVFPNPTSGRVNIEFLDNSVEYAEFLVYDIQGKKLFKNTLDTEKKSIHLENIQSGIYFYEIKSEGQIVRDKLIIQK